MYKSLSNLSMCNEKNELTKCRKEILKKDGQDCNNEGYTLAVEIQREIIMETEEFKSKLFWRRFILPNLGAMVALSVMF